MYVVLYTENLFGINQRSGEVFLLSSLDRETKDSYAIKIVAKDGGGKTALSSSVQLSIHVIDVNDNPPIFYPKEYFVLVPPSDLPLSSSRLPLETPIIELYASDEDVALNSRIQYNWDTSNELTENQLRLNSETGEIFPQRSFSISYENVLNRGSEPQMLKVYATDGGGRRSPESAIIYLYSNTVRDGSDKLFQETNLEFSILEDNSLVKTGDEGVAQRKGIIFTKYSCRFQTN